MFRMSRKSKLNRIKTNFSELWKDIYDFFNKDGRTGLDKLYFNKLDFIVEDQSLFWFIQCLGSYMIGTGFDSFGGILDFDIELKYDGNHQFKNFEDKLSVLEVTLKGPSNE